MAGLISVRLRAQVGVLGLAFLGGIYAFRHARKPQLRVETPQAFLYEPRHFPLQNSHLQSKIEYSALFALWIILSFTNPPGPQGAGPLICPVHLRPPIYLEHLFRLFPIAKPL